MDQQQLDSIKGRLAAAKKAPWELSGHATIYGPSRRFGSIVTATGWGNAAGPADRELIAHAPQDLAALVAEVERLRALLAERGGRDANEF